MSQLFKYGDTLNRIKIGSGLGSQILLSSQLQVLFATLISTGAAVPMVTLKVTTERKVTQV